MSSSPDLSQWRTARDYIEAGGAGSVFPTFASFEWFVRSHRPELVARGVYIPRPGRAGSLVANDFGAVALDILRRQTEGGRAA